MGQPRPLLSFIFGVVKVKIGMWEDIETETTVNCDRPSILFFLIKRANPGLFCRLFSVFSNKHRNKF